MISENLLQFIWRYQLFNHQDLRTVRNEPIQVVKAGLLNSNAGPDFTNARIIIDQNDWNGNVEIHINSSDWLKHKHDLDENYKSVILHVVLNHDSDYPNIPTLELNGRISRILLTRYDHLLTNKGWIPCEQNADFSENFKLKQFRYRLAIEKLEKKSEYINQLFSENESDWNQVFHVLLFRSFGFNVNNHAFEELALRIPYKLILKNAGFSLSIESLLLGASGLLSGNIDKELEIFKNEYNHLKAKYQIVEMLPQNWKYARMRPVNFPGIRISQLANLYFRQNRLFAQLIESETVTAALDLLECEASSIWNRRYKPDDQQHGDVIVKNLGIQSARNILINCVVPTMFAYATYRNIPELKEKAMHWLELLPSEENTIISNWKKMGASSKNALDSQAYLYLKKEYCDSKNCLNCLIGTSILKPDNEA